MKKIKQVIVMIVMALCGAVAVPAVAFADGVDGGVGGSDEVYPSDQAYEATKQQVLDERGGIYLECASLWYMTGEECYDIAYVGPYGAEYREWAAREWAINNGEPGVRPSLKPARSQYIPDEPQQNC